MKTNRQKSKTTDSAELLAERIAVVRDECQRAVRVLSSRRRSSESKLVECARLGDSLEATHQFLRCAVARIVISKVRRQNGGGV